MATPRKSPAPANAKQPQDRQTARSEVIGNKTEFDWKGTTYTVDPDLLDDLEFFEALEDNQIASAVRKMLGVDQYTTFKDQVKEAEGRVSLETTSQFLKDFMAEAKRGNS